MQTNIMQPSHNTRHFPFTQSGLPPALRWNTKGRQLTALLCCMDCW